MCDIIMVIIQFMSHTLKRTHAPTNTHCNLSLISNASNSTLWYIRTVEPSLSFVDYSLEHTFWNVDRMVRLVVFFLGIQPYEMCYWECGFSKSHFMNVGHAALLRLQPKLVLWARVCLCVTKCVRVCGRECA